MQKLTIAAAALTLTLAGCGTSADRTNYAYGQRDQSALANLQEARAILEDRDDSRAAARDESDAVTAIDKAIGQIRTEAPEVNRGAMPPAASHYNHADGLRRSEELLDAADHDLRVESTPRGWRIDAIRYIEDARHFVSLAIDDRRDRDRY